MCEQDAYGIFDEIRRDDLETAKFWGCSISHQRDRLFSIDYSLCWQLPSQVDDTANVDKYNGWALAAQTLSLTLTHSVTDVHHDVLPLCQSWPHLASMMTTTTLPSSPPRFFSTFPYSRRSRCWRSGAQRRSYFRGQACSDGSDI